MTKGIEAMMEDVERLAAGARKILKDLGPRKDKPMSEMTPLEMLQDSSRMMMQTTVDRYEDMLRRHR